MTTTPLTASSIASAVADPIGLEAIRVFPNSSGRYAPVDVRVVQWPVAAGSREQLHALGIPRVLVVAPGAHPPDDLDDLEEWLRLPYQQADLEVRAITVARRARALLEQPWVDDDNRLWFANQWRSLPVRQVEVVRLLVAHYGNVVRDEEIHRALAGEHATVHTEAVKTLIRRIQSGIAPLGLKIMRVRASGYLLDAV